MYDTPSCLKYKIYLSNLRRLMIVVKLVNFMWLDHNTILLNLIKLVQFVNLWPSTIRRRHGSLLSTLIHYALQISSSHLHKFILASLSAFGSPLDHQKKCFIKFRRTNYYCLHAQKRITIDNLGLKLSFS